MHRALLILALASCATDLELDDAEDAASLPDFHGRFGSPTIAKDDNDTLHAYFPIQAHKGDRVNVTHARSHDGGVTWQRVGEALPKLGPAVKPDSTVWAPGIARIADDHWMLYYTATQRGTERHMCTFRAHANSPRGPFVDDYAHPLVCPDGGLWAIDPYPVQDAQGDWHLLARVDEPNGNNTISIRALGPRGEQFRDGSVWRELTHINQGGWEEPVMENAAIVRLGGKGEKRWFVFYSGGSYKDDTYAVGYADCGASIHGPCVKKTVNAPWLASRPDLKMFGPGTPTFFREGGKTIMAVNTWKFSGGFSNPKNSGQTMHLFEVHLNAQGKPVAKFLRMVE